MPHWIFQKVVMRNKFLIWNGLKRRGVRDMENVLRGVQIVIDRIIKGI